MDTRETPAAKAAKPPKREPRDICALAIQRTFLTHEEMVLPQTVMCCLLLPKKREVTHNPSRLLPKRFSMPQEDWGILQMLGCQAIALPNTEQIVPQLFCVVLPLDSWNYYSGEQA